MAVSFTYGGTSVTFSRLPDMGEWSRTRKWLSPVARAGAGEDRFVYDKSLVREIHTLSWRDMTAADWSSLSTFLTAIDGVSHSFTYVDPAGTSWTATLWNAPNVSVSPSLYGRYEATIELLVSI
ncbi:MAG TPA: hypothetical protein PLL11_17230 [Spirochaetota bacterium]|nr:hypothetical protein [Spirochaetota bacterium]